MNWNALYDYANAQPHQGVPGVLSCSKISDVIHCGEYQNSYTSGESAMMGTAIHYALEINYMPKDAPDEAIMQFNFCKSIVRKYIDEDWQIISVEKYLETDYLTGKIDLLLGRDGDYLILDYKTGHTPVCNNAYQFAGNAHLIWKCLNAHGRIYSLAVQIGNDSPPHLWDKGDVYEAVQKAVHNKELMAGAQCTYCCKKKVCVARSTQLSITDNMMAKLNNDVLTPEDAGDIYSLGKAFEDMAATIKTRLGEEAKNGMKIAGARLMAGKKSTKIASPVEIFRAIKKDYDISSEEFFSNCKVDATYLKKLFKKPLDEVIPAHISETRGSGYLVREKK